MGHTFYVVQNDKEKFMHLHYHSEAGEYIQSWRSLDAATMFVSEEVALLAIHEEKLEELYIVPTHISLGQKKTCYYCEARH